MACDTKRERITISNEVIIEFVTVCETLGQRLDLRDFADGWIAGSKIGNRARGSRTRERERTAMSGSDLSEPAASGCSFVIRSGGSPRCYFVDAACG